MEVKRFDSSIGTGLYRRLGQLQSSDGKIWVVYENYHGMVAAMPSDSWSQGIESPEATTAFNSRWDERRANEQQARDDLRFGLHTSRGIVVRVTRTQIIIRGHGHSYRYCRTSGRRRGFGWEGLTDEDLKHVHEVVGDRHVVDIVEERRRSAEADVEMLDPVKIAQAIEDGEHA